MIYRKDIQIRDPFIIAVKEESKYYLYGTTDKNCWSADSTGFDTYSSSDLEKWEGPFSAFRPDKGFWADRNFWAPEVNYYNGMYYMFASFKAEKKCRGTQILISEYSKGPFIPYSDEAITPKHWECLDGTLFVDENKEPWIVFCREWLQVQDGEMYAMKLSHDLKSAIEEPVLLFKASSAPWSCASIGKDGSKNYVTDGPFMHKAQNGELVMLWSTHGNEGYTIGTARSKSGSILGPWSQDDVPLFSKDGGHGMLFYTFDNRLMLTIHMPNQTPDERPVFFELEEIDGKLKIK